jgi:hypothetical protein
MFAVDFSCNDPSKMIRQSLLFIGRNCFFVNTGLAFVTGSDVFLVTGIDVMQHSILLSGPFIRTHISPLLLQSKKVALITSEIPMNIHSNKFQNGGDN